MNQLHEYQVSIRVKLLFCFCGYLGSSNSSRDRTEGLAEGPVRDGSTRHGRQDDVRVAQRSQRCAAAAGEHARQHVCKVSFAFKLSQNFACFYLYVVYVLQSQKRVRLMYEPRSQLRRLLRRSRQEARHPRSVLRRHSVRREDQETERQV